MLSKTSTHFSHAPRRRAALHHWLSVLVVLVQVFASLSVVATAVVQPSALAPVVGAPKAVHAAAPVAPALVQPPNVVKAAPIAPALARGAAQIEAAAAAPPAAPLAQGSALEIGNDVWKDNNANGLQDAGEPGIPGVTVGLYDASGNQVQCPQVGRYDTYADAFTSGVSNGSTGSLTWGTTWSFAGSAAAATTNGNPGGSMYVYGVTTATAARTVDLSVFVGPPTLRFDYIRGNGVASFDVQYSSNGGTSFTTLATLNVNSDIYQTITYTLPITVANAQIRLQGATGGSSIYAYFDNLTIRGQMRYPVTTVTDANGLYTFTSVNCVQPSTTYQVQIDTTQNPLAGLFLTSQNAGGVTSNSPTADDTDSDANSVTISGKSNAVISLTAPAAGVNDSYDFGFIPVEIGNLVWKDNNTNGLQDAGEPGIAGVTVGLYDNSGNQVQCTPVGRVDTYVDQFSTTGNTNSNGTLDWSSKAWVFNNSTSISGSNGNPGGSLQVYGGSTGYYATRPVDLSVFAGNPLLRFDYNMAGTASQFNIQYSSNGGTSFTTLAVLSDNNSIYKTITYTLPITVANAQIRIQGQGTGTWAYFDNLTIRGQVRYPVITVTDSNGLYTFTGAQCVQPSTTYQVRIDTTQDRLVGLFLTSQNAGGVTSNSPTADDADSDASSVTISGKPNAVINATSLAAGVNYSYDFGFIPVEIGNAVWKDNNANGLQEAGEPGIAGVTVGLYNASGNLMQCAQVGRYDTYRDEFSTGGNKDSNGTLDWSGSAWTLSGSVAIQTSGGNPNGTLHYSNLGVATRAIDLSVFASAPTLSFDYDFTGSGATIQLQYSTDGGSSFTTLATLTDASGVWKTATYTVPLTALVSNAQLRLNATAVPGHAYFDNLTIRGPALYPVTTVTDANGHYTFTGANCVQPNTSYQVRIDMAQDPLVGLTLTAPNAGGVTSNDSTLDDSDSDASIVTISGKSNAVINATAPAAGVNDSYDFGFVPVEIGNKIWRDTNGNGLQDAGEPGIAGVTVGLYDASGNLMQCTQVGRYDTYRDEFSTGGSKDSNGTLDWSGAAWTLNDASIGTSGGNPGGSLIVFGPSTNNYATRSVDLSVFVTAPTLSFDYRMMNGAASKFNIQYSSDGGTSFTTLVMLSDNNSGFKTITYTLPITVANAQIRIRGQGMGSWGVFDNLTIRGQVRYPVLDVTDANGLYSFTGANCVQSNISYQMRVDTTQEPTNPLYGLLLATLNAGGVTSNDPVADDMDADAVNVTSGNKSYARINVVSPAAGVNDSYDFGFVPVEIGNKVWKDTNANGLQDVGEPGIPGVMVGLYDASGNAVQCAQTGWYDTYQDRFAGDGLTSSGGTLDWTSRAWVMTNAGTSTGWGNPDGSLSVSGGSTNSYATRSVDLSVFITVPTLSFAYDMHGYSSKFNIQYSSDGGASFTTLAVLSDNNNGYKTITYTLPITVANAQIRLGGYGTGVGAHFDNLTIRGYVRHPVTMVTDSNGLYSFTGAQCVQPGASYQVRIDSDQAALIGFSSLTVQDVGGVTSNDPIGDDSDSDASMVSTNNAVYAMFIATSSAAGINDSYDFGFVPSVGVIVIHKATLPAGSSQGFGFTSNVPGHTSFTLNDGGSYTMTGVLVGTYAVTEVLPSGWTQAQSVCTTGSTLGAIAVKSNTTTICNMLNAAQPTTSNVLTVTKTVNWNGNTPDASQKFNISLIGPAYPSGKADMISAGQTKVYTNVVAGVYTVTETGLGAGWVTTYTVGSTNSKVNGVMTLGATTIAPTTAGLISGKVYRDFNENGQFDSSNPTEVGLAGVSVTAYDPNGVARGSATTDANGNYSFTPTGSGPYRVELSNVPAGYYPSKHGSGNGTSTQFVLTNGGASNVNVGVNSPSDYSQSNPMVVSNMYVNGDTAVANSHPTLVLFPYDRSTSSPTTLATNTQIGSTWGLAYDRSTQMLYASAFLKRHAGMGPNGPGAIYAVNVATGAVSLFADLAALGANVGTVASNADRGLGLASLTSLDSAAYAQISKVALGDIDMSDDEHTLYVVSLNDKTLYALNVPAGTLAGSNVIPDPGCVGGAWRPFGLKYYQGHVYVGGVCDAQSSQQKSDLRAVVYRLDGNTFTSILNVSLNYPKGYVFSTCPTMTGWYPWLDRVPTTAPCGTSYGQDTYMYPQPILSDLEFDVDGSLILGLRDRTADQMGTGNLNPTGTVNPVTSNSLIRAYGGGDILRACLVGSAYVLAGTSAACPNNLNNNQGPGGGEYYYGDMVAGVHEEISNGGLALLPGSGNVLLTAMDPVVGFSGGVLYLDNVRGSATGGYTTQTDGWTFIKGSGVGDVELLSNPPPLEIGNRVWNDFNGNGVQDPGEPGLANVTVALQSASGTLTTNTDANGLYYFTVSPNTAYTLTINPAQAALSGLSLTQANAQAISGSPSSNDGFLDTRDNDAVTLNGKATILYTTGSAGQNNHGLDFGFTQPVSGQVTITNKAPDFGAVIIRKATLPAGSSQTFAFTSNVPGYTSFTLRDGDSYTMTAVVVGTYAVTETLPSGWTQAASNCTNVSTLGALQVSKDVTTTCSIVNAVQPTLPSNVLTVTKTVDWNSNTPDPTKAFNITITGPSFPSGKADTLTAGQTKVYTNVVAGVYTVTETSPGAGWTAVYTATPGIGGSSNAAVTLGQVAQATPGLTYAYYNSAPASNTVDNIPTSTPDATGTVTSFTLAAANQGDTSVCSLRYTGSINIATPGSYTFYTSSDDGSKLLIDGVQVVNNDGAHGTQEASGTVTLAAGSHTFTLLYFDSGGGQALTVQWAGPSITKQAIPFSVFGAGPISGKVYRDFNENGQLDSSNPTEVGVAGVTVTAYDPNGVARGSATTAANGNYSFTPTGNGPYRLELSNLPVGYYPSTHGSGNGTSTQFVTTNGGASNVNFGVNDPADYSQANPDIVVPLYINGDTNTTAPTGALVKFAYNNAGTSPTPTTVATKAQLGSTWGLAYARTSKTLYAAAFLKRNVGLGPNGLGAIYAVNPATGATTLFADLAALGANIGTVLSNSARGLGGPTSASNDPTTYAQIGKVGLGDIDIAADERTLYVVSLNDKTLYALNVPAGTLAGSYAIPDPGCTGGNWRPFALKAAQGDVYVGGVCDAQTSQQASDLRAYVYRFTPGANSFTAVLTFALNYSRITSCPPYGAWLPWLDTVPPSCAGNGPMLSLVYPQPLLTDIEVDIDGSLLLGFTDRTALQMGYHNHGPTGTQLYDARAQGDLLRAYNNHGIYVLENNGTAGAITTSGANNQNGPGGGEFYYGDASVDSTLEGTLGGLALKPGNGEVVATFADPVNLYSNGVRWFNNTTGNTNHSYELYQSSYESSVYFAKGAGLGDLELLLDPPPLEIGNRVWNDRNANGVQDPGEPGINGVQVSLQGPTTTVTVNTSGDGNYYFGNLRANTAYTLTINPVQTALSGLSLTQANAQAISGNPSSNDAIKDTRDNDAVTLNGKATILYTTGSAGQNNHGLDFGFTQPVSGQVTINNKAPDFGAVIIRKATLPAGSSQTFAFTSNVPGYTSFTLRDGDSYTMTAVVVGTYAVTETLPSGWTQVASSCTNVSTLGALRVSKDVTTTCSILNAVQPPLPSNVLTVTKTVNWNNNTPNAGQPFAINIIGPSFPSGKADTLTAGQTKVYTNVVAGVYTVTETSPGAGWVTTYTVGSTTSTAHGVATLSGTAIAPTTAGPISGKVYRDFNSDGQLTANGSVTDTGVAGVTVTAYDPNGVARGNATTAANGNYSFTPTGSGPYRLELTNLPAGYYPTTHGSGNGTSTQFVTTNGGASNINFGINDPVDYSQSNPDMVVPLYINGDTNTIDPTGTLVKFAYNNSGTTPTPTTVATKAQLGSIWGLAYARTSKTLYAAAFLKRNAGLGPNGLGAIYAVNPATGATTLFADLAALGANIGTVLSNSARGLGAPTSPNNDPTTYTQIGKVGLGDIDLAEDGRTLYVVSLNDKTLYALTVPAGTLAGRYAIPDPGCTGGNWRPFALKAAQGNVYVGGVCDAQTAQQASDLRAYIYRFTPGVNTFTTVLTFALNYPRVANCPPYGGWLPWLDTLPPSCAGNGVILFYPQPVLTDIEVDIDGSLLLGFTDRTAHQMGFLNHGPTGTQIYDTRAHADLLRAYNNHGVYVLENNGTAGAITTSGANNQDGPGGGEFYGDTAADGNMEATLGGLALKPGNGEVVATFLDPVNLYSNGVSWFSNTTGNKNRSYELYPDSRASSAYFAKGVGLGDLELLLDPAPLEIGNRVWNDLNGNGVQDPGEPGINGVQVSLQGPTTTVSINTSGDGNYYFGNLRTNTAYTLTINPSQAALSGLTLTQANLQAISGNPSSNDALLDTRDSDAVLINSKATIYYTTGSAGQNNHGLDFGFTQPLSGQVTIINKAPRLDLGDNPDRYNTVITNTGAAHVIVAGLFLGAAEDDENDGQPSLGADGDGADEDGVQFPPLRAGATAIITVTATNTGTQPAILASWLDFNGNGLFEASERITTTVPAGTASGVFTLTYTIPADAVSDTYARFRLSTDPAVITPTGVATDGEVEDYPVTIQAPLVQFGDRVWIESDSDGLAASGVITPLAGMVITATNGTQVYTTRTAANGYYSFTVEAGTYTVTYGSIPGSYGSVLPSSAPGGSSTSGNAGSYQESGNPDRSHANRTTVTLTPGQANWQLDFAFHTPRVELRLAKQVSQRVAKAGDTLTYTLVVTNDGPDLATGVQVEDRLPATVTYQSATAQQGAYDATTGLWTVGTIPVGSSVTLTLTVQIK